MEYKPLDGRQFPRFSGIKTFFRLPIAEIGDDYDVGIVGVPFDGGVSYRPGGRFAPSRIRESSSLGRGFHWSRGINFFKKIKVADIGDCPTIPVDLKRCHEGINKFFADLVSRNKKFVAIGGDHSITLPILRAVSQHYGKPLNLIHFDAHLDTYPAAWGEEFHHGTFARHAIDEKLVNPKTSMQIGIRGPLAADEDLDFVRKHQVMVRTVDDVRAKPLPEFLKTLPEFKGPTYISFDIDCLDPAYAPGTGTPVVGGLTTYETQNILRALKIDQLVGCDIVEVSPPYDHADITSLAAMDTLFEMLCLLAQNA